MVRNLPLLLLLSLPAFASQASQENLNIVWIIVAAAMVFLMQAGFTALESGLVRAKNSINVAIKNISDMTFSIVAFFIIGYALMFGADASGFVGTDSFFLHGKTTPDDYAFFIFQAVFAGTAATIVSGAVAERIKFGGYLVVATITSALIYPVSGHWVWGEGGWLVDKGFVDFAGSTVVHSVGAWVGLAGALVLGPRLGRFDENGEVNKLPGSSIQMAALGVFILWFGWFGFNGGSTLAGDGSIAKVVVNTSLAAAVGGITCFLLSKILMGKADVEKMLNGILGGLVGITAGCAAVEPVGALWIGIGGGAVVYFSEIFLIKVLKVDDPVGAISVHGSAGAWGTLALALFAPVENLPAGSMMGQLWIQFQGVMAAFLWAFVLGLVLFFILRMFNQLRVPPDFEVRGLNEMEHGAKQTMLETYDAIQYMVNTGDYTKKIEVEVGTEAGDIARVFNVLVDEVNNIAEVADNIAKGDLGVEARPKTEKDKLGSAISEMVQKLRGFVVDLQHVVEHIQHSSNDLSSSSSKLVDSNQQLYEGIMNVTDNMSVANEAVVNMQQNSSEGIQSIELVVSSMQKMEETMNQFKENIDSLSGSVSDIEGIVGLINDIADQTNLLALNAAIEAARAGEHGRGFAVVADEVRQLAEKTQKATTEIKLKLNVLKEHSDSAVRATDEGVEVIQTGVEKINHTNQIFSMIQEAVTNVRDKVGEVSSIADQQKQLSELAHKATSTVSETIKSVGSQVSSLQKIASYFNFNIKNDSPAPLPTDTK